MTMEELWEEVAKIKDDDRREAARELLSQCQRLEKEVLDRLIRLINPKFDLSGSDS